MVVTWVMDGCGLAKIVTAMWAGLAEMPEP